MSLANSEKSDFFLADLDALYFFLCLIAEGRTSSSTLDNSGERVDIPVLFLTLEGKLLVFPLLGMILALGFSYMAITSLKYVSSKPIYVRVLIMNGCWTLSSASSASIEKIICLSFPLLM